jgi:hypothetical protein
LVNNVELTQVGNEFVNEATGDSYNPALPEFGDNYTLEMHNGTQLVINATTGDLNQIVDTNGNTLTFGNNGSKAPPANTSPSRAMPPATSPRLRAPQARR